ncbi:MAG: DUF6868 family protein [Alphaproteobacteria bacterium]
MIISVIACTKFKQDIYKFHSKWFKIPEETYDIMLFFFLGLFKVLIVVFAFIPFLTSCIAD